MENIEGVSGINPKNILPGYIILGKCFILPQCSYSIDYCQTPWPYLGMNTVENPDIWHKCQNHKFIKLWIPMNRTESDCHKGDRMVMRIGQYEWPQLSNNCMTMQYWWMLVWPWSRQLKDYYSQKAIRKPF